MTDTIAIQTIEVDGATKYKMEFPLTDEKGQPILDGKGQPRFTNLIGDTVEEVAIKTAQANLNLSRLLNRNNQFIETLKNKNPTPARKAPEMRGRELTQDEKVQIGLDAQDPRKAADAMKRVVESVVPVAEITGEVQRQGHTIDLQTRRSIARVFFDRHPEYNTEANGQMLRGWLEKNGYEFTLDNIEIAFATIQSSLGPIAPPRNDPPAPTPDRNASPGNEPPNPGNPPTQPRRAPVSGIRDSQASGVPLTGKHFPYTKDQLLQMAYSHDKRYDELISNPATNAMVNAVLSGR